MQADTLTARCPADSGRRLLQYAVLLAGLVPVLAGGAGVVFGINAIDRHGWLSLSGDSHVRYLSGLILGIGLGFWSTVPAIEAQGARFRLLTALVLIGGLARLYALIRFGAPDGVMLAGLLMELAVTPGLALWRERVEWKLAACRTDLAQTMTMAGGFGSRMP